ncbi:MAG: hypothetical protein J6Q81_02320, partial [Lentisphaeria bacterium]|nr:hypothetical protein [Lentisphaeria bacterium]
DVNGNVIASGIKLSVSSLNQLGSVVSSYSEDMASFLARNITDPAVAAQAATVVLNNVTVYGSDAAGTEYLVETQTSGQSQDIRRKEVTLDWSDTVADWTVLLNSNGLLSDTGVIFKEITGYELTLRVIDTKGQKFDIQVYPTDDLDGSITLDLKELCSTYGAPFQVDSIETVNLVGVKVLGKASDGKDLDFVYDFTDTKTQQDVDRIAKGMTFNWSVMYEDIANKAVNGLLSSNNGESLPPPDDVTIGYKYIYNITFVIYDTDGNYLGEYTPAGGFDSYIGRLDFEAIEAENGWSNVGDAAIKEVAVDVIYGTDAQGHDKIFTVHYDYPEVGITMFCNTIKTSWSEAELLAANPAITYTVTGYKITFMVKDKSGNNIGEVTRSFDGNNTSYGVDLTEAAKELNVPRENIGSVALQEVTALGVDLNLETSLKPTGNLQPGSKPTLVLDWSALDQEIINGEFLSKIDTPKSYVIYYNIKAGGNVLASMQKLPPSGEQLYVGSSGSYTFDLEMLAKKYGVAAEDIEIEVAKLTVYGTAQGVSTSQELIGFNNVSVVSPRTPVSVIGCENLQTYLSQSGYGNFASVTYTYRFLDENGDVLGLIENSGTASASDQLSITINGNGGAGYIYLKDNEYLLEGDATLSDVAAVEIVKVEVSDGVNPSQSFNSIAYDEITRDSELEWTGEAAALAAELTNGTLAADDGKLFAEITGYRISYVVFDADGNILQSVSDKAIDSKDITSFKVNLTEYNQDNDDVFAEITGLTVIGKDGSGIAVSKSVFSDEVERPEIVATLDWSHKTWADGTVGYNVWYAAVDKDGNVLYENTTAHQVAGRDTTSLTVNLIDYSSNGKFDLSQFAELKLIKVDAVDAANTVIDSMANEGSAMLQIDLSSMIAGWNISNAIGGEAITAGSIKTY